MFSYHPAQHTAFIVIFISNLNLNSVHYFVATFSFCVIFIRLYRVH